MLRPVLATWHICSNRGLLAATSSTNNTRRIVSCETPESSATLGRDSLLPSARFNTVGHAEEGIPSAGFLGPDCMIYHHRGSP